MEGMERLNGDADAPDGGLGARYRLFGGQPLLLGPVEDGRPVLLGERGMGRRVAREEDGEQVAVGDRQRGVVDFDRLRVVAEPVVGRRGGRAPAVADPRADDAVQTPEPGVGSPESTEGEGRGREIGRLCGVERRARGRLRRGVREQRHGVLLLLPVSYPAGEQRTRQTRRVLYIGGAEWCGVAPRGDGDPRSEAW